MGGRGAGADGAVKPGGREPLPGDHSAGPGGFARGARPGRSLLPPRQRDLVQGCGDEAAKAPWADVWLVPEDGAFEIRLGDHAVTWCAPGSTPRAPLGGVDGGEGRGPVRRPGVEAMFRNYMTRCRRAVRSCGAAYRRCPAGVFVPAMGPLADAGVMARFWRDRFGGRRPGPGAAVSSDEAAEARTVPASWASG